MKLRLMDPRTAYRNDYLWLPKACVPNLDVIRTSLTFPTPDGVGVAAYAETATHLAAPREYIPYSDWSSLDFPVVDQTFEGFPRVNVRCNATPRGTIQKEAHQALLERCNGVLSLACGRGKTVVSIMAWCDLKVPALIVVHTQELMTQWKASLLQFTDLKEEEIGIYQGEHTDWQHPVCVAMLKTLALRTRSGEIPDGFREHFGVVIYDEVHNIGAPFFHDCAALGRGLRWGLSATHERPDGLDALYKGHLGPLIYQNLIQDVIPEAFFVRLNTRIPYDVLQGLYDKTGEISHARLMTWLSTNEGRNAEIVRVLRDAIADDRTILALSLRTEQVDVLAEVFDGVASKIHGKLGKERVGALHRESLVFATTSLAKEGLDRADLDAVMLLLPITQEGMFRQILGRVQRALPDKRTPVLIIFEDRHIDICVKMCRRLRTHLASYGYPSHIIDAQE